MCRAATRSWCWCSCRGYRRPASRPTIRVMSVVDTWAVIELGFTAPSLLGWGVLGPKRTRRWKRSITYLHTSVCFPFPQNSSILGIAEFTHFGDTLVICKWPKRGTNWNKERKDQQLMAPVRTKVIECSVCFRTRQSNIKQWQSFSSNSFKSLLQKMT